MAFDVRGLVEALSRVRPVFHSEADFQHAFAWELHRAHPNARIRLERPVPSKLGLLHLDLVADLEGGVLFVELKFKTKRLMVRDGEEVFSLQGHGAHNCGRYDFLNDVARLEAVMAVREKTRSATAWAIMLTNDSTYWCKPRGIIGDAVAFSLADGRRCSGRMDWTADTSDSTKRNRNRPIELVGTYCLEWRDYSRPADQQDSEFRYLAVEVN